MAEFSRRKSNCSGFALFIAAFLALLPLATGDEKRPWQLAYYPYMGKIRLAFEGEDTRPEKPVPVRVTDESGNDILNSSEPGGPARLAPCRKPANMNSSSVTTTVHGCGSERTRRTPISGWAQDRSSTTGNGATRGHHGQRCKWIEKLKTKD